MFESVRNIIAIPDLRKRVLFTLGLLGHGGCVGWHWYRYLDNDPADTVLDPVNISGNKGIVNIKFEPYLPLVEAMRSLNLRAYALQERLRATEGGTVKTGEEE